MQQFLGNSESTLLNLEAYELALAIVKKTLDENHLRTAQINCGQRTTLFQNR